jgi:hypothetical protein
MHGMIWAMEKRKVQWAEKEWLTHMHKFNYTHVDLLVITKMFCNYLITKEATNLRGKDVDLTIEGIAKVFKLPSIRTITRRKEGYSIAIAKDFIGGKKEHYTLHFGYVICKANGQLKVMKLEALTKKFTLK